MGTRRTHDDRLERLREEGLTEDELARLRSPIGLDIGARTPEETAVSIAAEIVADPLGRHRPPAHRAGRPDPSLSWLAPLRSAAIALIEASRTWWIRV